VNLIARKEGRLFFTGKREWASFDLLPFPSRELFDIKQYKEHAYSVGIQSKRGCSFGCIFCANKIICGNSFRLRPPKRVVDEIEMAVNDLGINDFFFADACFNFPLDHGRELCKELIKRNLDINWVAAFNPAFINLPFMEEAVKAGCELLSFSPDGASNSSMQFLGKNFSVNSVEKTITLAKKIDGANVGYSFLYDLPAYNDEHVLGLAHLVSKMKVVLRSKLRFLSFSKIRIYPYTQIYEIALKQGKINRSTDLLYPIHYESDSALNPASLLPSVLRGSLIIFDAACKKLIGDSTFKVCN